VYQVGDSHKYLREQLSSSSYPNSQEYKLVPAHSQAAFQEQAIYTDQSKQSQEEQKEEVKQALPEIPKELTVLQSELKGKLLSGDFKVNEIVEKIEAI